MIVEHVDTIAIKDSDKGGHWHLRSTVKEWQVVHFDRNGMQTAGHYWSRRNGGRDISAWAESQARANFKNRREPLPSAILARVH